MVARPGLTVLTAALLMGAGSLASTDAAEDRGAGLRADTPSYSIRAIRYATITDFPVAGLVMGAPEEERMDIAMAFWAVEGGGRTILFDTGFHRDRWFDAFDVRDWISPDSAVRLAGIEPGDVTDVIVSHAHWDHMGGIDRFPGATIWIQADELAWYTGPAWQDGGTGGGSDPGDLLELVRRNTEGDVRLVEGDGEEILPGIRVHTGARHTYASQYVEVMGGQGSPAWVLASDNAYLWRNLERRRPVATFTPADTLGSLRALDRMIELAGDVRRVIPGHDPDQFRRFPAEDPEGRVVRIR